MKPKDILGITFLSRMLGNKSTARWMFMAMIFVFVMYWCIAGCFLLMYYLGVGIYKLVKYIIKRRREGATNNTQSVDGTA